MVDLFVSGWMVISSVLLILLFYYLFRYISSAETRNKNLTQEVLTLNEQLALREIYKAGVPFKNKIPHICAGKNIYLIDYENIGCIPKAISEDIDCIIFVFVGNLQKNDVQRKNNIIDIKNNVYYINMDKTMHNYLDIYMSCWVGGMISIYTPKSIRILTKDKGFSAIIEATKVLGFSDIDYYIPITNLGMDDNFIRKIIKDISLLYSSNTIRYYSFKGSLKKIYPQFSIDEVNLFFGRAKRIGLIKQRKIGKDEYIDVLI